MERAPHLGVQVGVNILRLEALDIYTWEAVVLFQINKMEITTFLTFVSDQCGKAGEAIHFIIQSFRIRKSRA